MGGGKNDVKINIQFEVNVEQAEAEAAAAGTTDGGDTDNTGGDN